MKENSADMAIQAFRSLFSSFSIAALIITFVKGITDGSVLSGIVLSMFIYFLTEFNQYLEKIVYKQCILGDKSTRINTVCMIVALLLLSINFIFCFLDISQDVLLVVSIVDQIFALSYFALDLIMLNRQIINYQRN